MTQPCYVLAIFNRKYRFFFLFSSSRTCVTSVFSVYVCKNRQQTVESSIKMLIWKVPMRIKFILNSKGKKSSGTLNYTIYSMNNVRVSERQRHWFWWNRVVVSRFRITKWPTGMPYRICDYWLQSVFSSLLYQSFILDTSLCTWLQPRPYARRTGLLKVNNTGQRFLIITR